ncbi:helix-turn-helix domain-containing protein [Rhodococcus hoagii]|nr:helix-turn-helix domain-containing protein [Prescottella equi]
MRWHTRQTAYGRFESRYVDARPVREHVQQLHAAAMSAPTIAAAAGVSLFTVRGLLAGADERGTEPAKRVLRVVAEKLVAVAVPYPGVVPPSTPDGCQVEGVGTRRRLRSLVAAGYTQRDLAGRLGWNEDTISRIITARTTGVTAGHHRDVEALFRELQLVPGASASARARGRRSGWALPMQWDEETIDDPKARPEPPRAPVSHRRTA